MKSVMGEISQCFHKADTDYFWLFRIPPDQYFGDVWRHPTNWPTFGRIPRAGYNWHAGFTIPGPAVWEELS